MAQTPALIILAGDASSCMWPLREKSLLRFGTEPLLMQQLRRYQALGFSEAVVVANPENHAEISELAAQIRTMPVQVVVQHESKGMGDALLQTAPLFRDRPRTPVYINQVHDVVDDSMHTSLLRAFQNDPTQSYIAGYEREDYFPGGYLIVSPSGRITGMIEKPGPERKPSKLVMIVAHVHAEIGRLLDAIHEEYGKDIPGDDHYERALVQIMKTHAFRVVPYRGPWNALKYPWHVLDVMQFFLSKIRGQSVAESAFIARTAALVGDVFIGERVKIFPGAAVVGPAYIGADTVIGNNALVRGSMVLNQCEVGFTSEVARSYVADNCHLHACRVLGSIFAPGVSFSAGCTTANWRIDKGRVSSSVEGQKIDSGRDKLGAIIGRDAFLGVDVMTMPGVKIGEGAQVGPGTHVFKDVLNRQRVYVKQTIEVVDAEE